MKKFMDIMLLMALVAGVAFAGDSDKHDAKAQTINGYLVDVACAADNASHPEPSFPAKHTKGCLQMPACVQSGYAILTDDNKVVKLDKQSNETAKKLIADTDKTDNWKISATGVLKDDGFAAQSLKLQ